MRRSILITFLIAMVAGSSGLFSACTNSSGNSAVNPANPPVSTNRGSISAIMDGTSWNAKVIGAASYNKETLTISGADNSNPLRALAFTVRAGGPGTHKIDATINDTTSNAVLTIGGAVWQAVPLVRGNGTIDITTLTPTGASGTFSFSVEAVPGSSATGTKTITSGTFNVTFAK